MTSKDASEQMASAVRKRRERRDRWLREGSRALLRNLGLVGSLGWLPRSPPLGGALLGRWLDNRYGSGVFWSATLIFLRCRPGRWARLTEGEEVVTGILCPAHPHLDPRRAGHRWRLLLTPTPERPLLHLTPLATRDCAAFRRWALLTLALVVAARAGALPLLCVTGGTLIARLVVVRPRPEVRA